MTSIGFEHIKNERANSGAMVRTYKYYPKYLNNQHYTLLVFNPKGSLHSDHRLYIHNNGIMLSEVVYDINTSKINLLEDHIKEVFVREVRTITINEIIA